MSDWNDNPEWTRETEARSRSAEEVHPPHVVEALVKRRPGRPSGSLKQRVTLRLDRDAIDRLRAGGPGWQTRINDAVRKAAGLAE